MRPPSRATALGLAVALCCAGTGAAQSQELTFDAALALARERAPELVQAAARSGEARGRVAGAAPLFRENPTLQGAAGPRHAPGTTEGGLQLSVGLSQAVELGGKRGSRLEAARAGVTQAEALRADAERRVLGEVAGAFSRVLHAQARVGLAESAREAAQTLVEVAERRFGAGDVPVLDVNVARVALVRARAELAEAEGGLALQLASLREGLGLPAHAPLAVRGELASVASRPVPAAPGPRADLVALEAELQEAEATLRLGTSEAWPDVTLGVSYEQEGQERAVTGGLGVRLPLFQRGQEGRLTGGARVRRLQLALEAARRARDVQVEAARLHHARAMAAAELLRVEALPLVEDSLSLAAKAYSAGEMPLAELLLVRREALETRASYLERQLAAALAHIQLAVQLGGTP